MNLKSLIGKKISYSRYRGLNDNSRYELTDFYFAKEINGCLVCTDTEYDIDCDGNICLVWEDEMVAHIGTIPNLEEGAGKPEIRFYKDHIAITSKFFLDNSHHHADYETVKIDLSENAIKKWRSKTELLYLVEKLNNKFKAYKGGSYRNQFNCWLGHYNDCPYLIVDSTVNIVSRRSTFSTIRRLNINLLSLVLSKGYENEVILPDSNNEDMTYVEETFNAVSPNNGKRMFEEFMQNLCQLLSKTSYSLDAS